MKHLKKFNEDFDWDEVLKSNRNPKDKDKWSELEKDMVNIVEKYMKVNLGLTHMGLLMLCIKY